MKVYYLYSKYVYLLNDTTYCQNLNFTVTEITKSIESLKTGKANGPDGLSAEHFKLCGNRLAVLLSFVFTSMSSHCFIPENFQKSVIIPLVKDKTGDITDKNNYHPIALSTMMSKIIEKIFMDRYESLFCTTDNQLGFEKDYSTDMCAYSLKEIVDIYRSQFTPIFICFLDASKAFDKINYWLLFHKLINRNVPLYIVRFLCFLVCTTAGLCTMG